MLYSLEQLGRAFVLRLGGDGADDTNKLSRARVLAVTECLGKLTQRWPAHNTDGLVITGNTRSFSAGADLEEIAALTAPAAYEFAAMGQRLMSAVANFPAPTIAAVHGYCMGGGLDLALACTRRIVGPHAIFGHRGAALGLITGWGGTQRLPRLVGKARAIAMFIAAEKIHPRQAVDIGLADELADDPLHRALEIIEQIPLNKKEPGLTAGLP